MAMKSESPEVGSIRKVDHHVFHADEERELDARSAELSKTNVHLPNWATTDHWVPAREERSAIVFGAFGLL
jgi:hypothetical protein